MQDFESLSNLEKQELVEKMFYQLGKRKIYAFYTMFDMLDFKDRQDFFSDHINSISIK